MDDNELLADDGVEGPGGRSLVDELFGTGSSIGRGQASSRLRATDPSPTSLPTRKKPAVTFQEPSEVAAGSGGSFIDSLFPGGKESNAGIIGKAASPVRQLEKSSPVAASALESSSISSQQQQRTSIASSISDKELAWELEQLRREISAWRQEKSEDRHNIDRLHRRLESTMEEHQHALQKLNDSHKIELDSLRRTHSTELGDVTRHAHRADEILTVLNRNESLLEGFRLKLEAITDSVMGVRLQAFDSRDEGVEKVVRLTEEMLAQLSERLEQEKRELSVQREELGKRVEKELDALSKRYADEVVDARSWLEEEKRHLALERQAFQEEQITILAMVEQKREELEQLKSQFLANEHDLLLRVVNERALLEQQRREFERQRSGDVLRLRTEAQNLEHYLQQVEKAKRMLGRAQRSYEEKLAELHALKQLLLQYESEMVGHRREAKQTPN